MGYLFTYLNKEVGKEIKAENFVIQKPSKKLFTFSLNPENVEKLKALIEAEAQKRNAAPLPMSEVIDRLIELAIHVLERKPEVQAEQKNPGGEVDDRGPKCYYCRKTAVFIGVHQPSAKEYPLCKNHAHEVMDKAGDKWLLKPLPGEKAVLTEAVQPPGPECILRLLRDLTLGLVLRPEVSENPNKLGGRCEQ